MKGGLPDLELAALRAVLSQARGEPLPTATNPSLAAAVDGITLTPGEVLIEAINSISRVTSAAEGAPLAVTAEHHTHIAGVPSGEPSDALQGSFRSSSIVPVSATLGTSLTAAQQLRVAPDMPAGRPPLPTNSSLRISAGYKGSNLGAQHTSSGATSAAATTGTNIDPAAASHAVPTDAPVDVVPPSDTHTQLTALLQIAEARRQATTGGASLATHGPHTGNEEDCIHQGAACPPQPGDGPTEPPTSPGSSGIRQQEPGAPSTSRHSEADGAEQPDRMLEQVLQALVPRNHTPRDNAGHMASRVDTQADPTAVHTPGGRSQPHAPCCGSAATDAPPQRQPSVGTAAAPSSHMQLQGCCLGQGGAVHDVPAASGSFDAAAVSRSLLLTALGLVCGVREDSRSQGVMHAATAGEALHRAATILSPHSQHSNSMPDALHSTSIPPASVSDQPPDSMESVPPAPWHGLGEHDGAGGFSEVVMLLAQVIASGSSTAGSFPSSSPKN